ncbi:MAG TPA: ATP-binding protein [Pyrinomonadaceae bacterium]|nr:ATP-binding protein [Pyrinomonadaceae bacterium]
MNFSESTASNRASAASRPASNQLLQGIIDTAREAVFVVDDAMRIKASNSAANIAFSRGNGSLEDRRLSEIIRDIRLHAAFRTCIDQNSAADLKLEIGAIEKRIFDIHIAPFESDGRRYAIGFFYDVTKVERLEKVRQEFLSNISHELRTPLTSIMAFVETLEDGAIDDAENNRRFLTVIRRNAERMHVLIADILELSLIESGNVSIDKGDVRLAHLIDEIFDSLSTKADQREILLLHQVDPDARVFADHGRLEQMLTNLIDNAIKFNRASGTVEVTLRQTPGRSTISVFDTGEGIMAEHLNRIFERFYRRDRGRTREVGGTGLGLAIVKHLARLHGGEVTVESDLGRGTAFHIELPVE